jgi:hypothetical protein
VAGNFRHAGTLAVNYVARWNGTAWSALGTTPELYGATAVFVNGSQVYAGGLNGTALWDGAAWVTPPNNGVEQPRCYAAFNGEIYVGGGSQTNPCMRRRGAGDWYDAGGAPTYPVKAMCEYQGRLYAAGDFSEAGNAAAFKIASWDGAAWRACPANLPINSNVAKMTTLVDSVLMWGSRPGWYADGNWVLKWDGEFSQAFPTLPYLDSIVPAMWNGQYVIGGFRHYANATGPAVFMWTGGQWQTLGTGMVFPNDNSQGVQVLTNFNGDLVAGGNFVSADGVTLNRVARWNGTSWQPMGAGFADGYVYALCVAGTTLYAGGSFTTSNGAAVNKIARWDGAVWQPLGTGVPAGSAAVLALVAFQDQLVAGGTFTTMGGVGATGVALWDGAWHAMNSAGMNNVRQLAVYNGALVAAWDYTPRLARWDGTNWQALGGGLPLAPMTMAVYRGELLVGGGFMSAGSTVSPWLARWSDTGAPWIAESPAAARAALGGNARLDVVAAAGYSGLTYQWRRGGVALSDGPAPGGSVIAGAATASLLISGLSSADAGAYDCVVASACGSATSDAALLSLCGSADFNCDGDTGTDADIESFFACVAGVCPSSPCLSVADFNGDGDVGTDSDIEAFFRVLAGGTC